MSAHLRVLFWSGALKLAGYANQLYWWVADRHSSAVWVQMAEERDQESEVEA